MANPNLPSSKLINGNKTFSGLVTFQQKPVMPGNQDAVNVASGASQIGSVTNPFFGDFYARGQVYQQFSNQWKGPIANSFQAGMYPNINCIAFGNGRFVAAGETTAGGASLNVSYSTDFGATWSALIDGQFGLGGKIRGIAFGGNVFAIVGDDGKASFSTDNGSTWTVAATNPFGGAQQYAVGYGNGVFICGGQNVGGFATIARSTDGSNWTIVVTEAFNGSYYCVAWVYGVFLVGGQGSRIRKSTDGGVTWSAAIVLPGGTSIRSLAFGNNIFMAGNDNGQLFRSTDLGSSFSSVTSPFAAGVMIQSITFNNNIFTATANNGTIAKSIDNGLTWGSLITNPFGTNIIFGIGGDGAGHIVAVGQSANIATTGWLRAYSLVEPFAGEPSLGTMHSHYIPNIVLGATIAGGANIQMDFSSYVPIGTKAVRLAWKYAPNAGVYVLFGKVLNTAEDEIDNYNATWTSDHAITTLDANRKAYVWNPTAITTGPTCYANLTHYWM